MKYDTSGRPGICPVRPASVVRTGPCENQFCPRRINRRPIGTHDRHCFFLDGRFALAPPTLIAVRGESTRTPDRNAVELLVDNFHDWAKSSEYMRSSPVFAQTRSASSSIPTARTRPPSGRLVCCLAVICALLTRLLFARCSPAGNASAMAVIATMPDPSRATAISTRCSVASRLLDDRRKVINLRV